MGVAEEFLTLAVRLSQPASTDPEQACLRRAVSTAHYALFHLLAQEGVQVWNGSPSARLGLERVFEHRRMKEVSLLLSKGHWRGWSAPRLPVPSELKEVAQTFIDLQDARHRADYDNAKTWTPVEVSAQVEAVQIAFDSWRQIRSSPAAGEYLLSLLIGKKRE
jgi:uncharacterized protein (UPF0332 family)